MTEPVVLINAFEVPEGGMPAARAYWEAAREIMARQPGYLGTRLHEALRPDARFALVNIAEWESVAAFQAAAEALRRELPPAPEGLRYAPALYRVAAR